MSSNARRRTGRLMILVLAISVMSTIVPASAASYNVTWYWTAAAPGYAFNVSGPGTFTVTVERGGTNPIAPVTGTGTATISGVSCKWESITFKVNGSSAGVSNASWSPDKAPCKSAAAPTPEQPAPAPPTTEPPARRVTALVVEDSQRCNATNGRVTSEILITGGPASTEFYVFVEGEILNKEDVIEATTNMSPGDEVRFRVAHVDRDDDGVVTIRFPFREDDPNNSNHQAEDAIELKPKACEIVPETTTTTAAPITTTTLAEAEREVMDRRNSRVPAVDLAPIAEPSNAEAEASTTSTTESVNLGSVPSEVKCSRTELECAILAAKAEADANNATDETIVFEQQPEIQALGASDASRVCTTWLCKTLDFVKLSAILAIGAAAVIVSFMFSRTYVHQYMSQSTRHTVRAMPAKSVRTVSTASLTAGKHTWRWLNRRLNPKWVEIVVRGKENK